MQHRVRVFACASIIATCGTVHAAEIPDHYLSFGAVYSEPDDARRADYGSGGSIAYARRLNERNMIEGRLASMIFETGDFIAVDFYQTMIGADWVHSLGDERRQHFFVAAGGGIALNNVKPDTEDATSAYFDAAIGYRINAAEEWGVRPRIELRYIYDTFGDGVGDMMLGLTFEIPPRTERIIDKVVQVDKMVEVPVEIEKIVEKEIGCEIPGAQRPEGVPTE